MRSRRGFTVAELALSTAIFSMLLLVMLAALNQVSRLSLRTSSRDEAVGQLLKARAALLRDLANSSAGAGQFATTTVGPSAGSGVDGHALTFLSSDKGDNSASWSSDPNTGASGMTSQITYYLVIPAVANSYGIVPAAGAADAQGHDQQFPLKWLIRRVDPAGGTAVDPSWTSWLVRPTGPVNSATRQVISNRLFQFKVLSKAPVWTLELSAVAVQDARRKVALGSVPLSGSAYVVTQQVSVRAQNY